MATSRSSEFRSSLSLLILSFRSETCESAATLAIDVSLFAFFIFSADSISRFSFSDISLFSFSRLAIFSATWWLLFCSRVLLFISSSSRFLISARSFSAFFLSSWSSSAFRCISFTSCLISADSFSRRASSLRRSFSRAFESPSSLADLFSRLLSSSARSRSRKSCSAMMPLSPAMPAPLIDVRTPWN